ncbi:MAG: tRNA (adenosine(37)-N6)-threonylcarbamoyltransferase complex ATPase subunit type 1 TsaE [Gammaproteobacteria bacterium]|jgi:tRNA threonylcarbamoyladenosine biosynthesis protein TsaE|nr:tRNA (adenosine(37)-N6)-threonylcarbamoyltransferase complex ATPase subunit type 1 TsaE [Gammaproteobacteria bacterium]
MRVQKIRHNLPDEQATITFGAELAAQLIQRYRGRAVVFLAGQLGAGKTTLVRGLLAGLGHSGAVKSPTYTLLEPYSLGDHEVYHFDLYRVNDPQELEFVGFDEIVDGPGMKMFEWAEKAADWLPAPDVSIALEVNTQSHPVSRDVVVVFD